MAFRSVAKAASFAAVVGGGAGAGAADDEADAVDARVLVLADSRVARSQQSVVTVSAAAIR